MPKDRYFTEQNLKKNKTISIEAKEAIHIKTIMRKNLGDIIELVNGKGYLAKAKILKTNTKNIEVHIEDVVFEKDKEQKIILIQAILKAHKLDLILEKCTELGVFEIWFFKSENSEDINFSNHRINRMNNILISAMKQCSRLYLPKIKFLNSVKELANLDNIYFGDVRQTALKYFNISKKEPKNVYFVIGPESGFTKEEIFYLENEIKATGVKLNENILKAETAAIAAIAIINHLLQP